MKPKKRVRHRYRYIYNSYGNRVVLAKDQPEYLQLPAHTAGGDEGIITSCWKLTFTERLKILWSGKFWLQQMTFGHLLQPQKPSADKPTLKG